jgi:hypothetical protein
LHSDGFFSILLLTVIRKFPEILHMERVNEYGCTFLARDGRLSGFDGHSNFADDAAAGTPADHPCGGSLVFIVYGVLIHAYPVAILNGFIVGIDAFYLIRMFGQKDYLQLLEISHDSAYLSGLLDFYRDEIKEIYPDYVHEPQASYPTYLILRNMVPAGVIVQQREGAQAKILLDYVIPTYRDFQVARFLYHEKAGYFHSQGIERFIAAPGRVRHAQYLERMGLQLRVACMRLN